MNTDANKPSPAPHLSDNEIIDRFGGIRPMAAKLGIAVTTVQGWKARGHFPENRRQQILEAARSSGIDFDEKGTAPQAAAPPTPAVETSTPAGPADAAGDRIAGAPGKPAPKDSVKKEGTRPAADTFSTKEKPADSAGGTERLAWVALGLAVLVAVALLARPYWEPTVHGVLSGGATTVDLSDIEQKLDALNDESQAGYETLTGRIAALEAGGGETGAALATQLASLEKNLADFDRTLESLDRGMKGADDRLAALEAARGEVPESVTASLRQTAADIKAVQATIAALGRETASQDARLTELETRPVQTGERIAALALAVGQVEAALNSGLPYQAALDRLMEIAPDDKMVREGVAILYPWSGAGIPSRPTLLRRFAEIAPDIDRALADTGGETWVDRAWHSVSTLVTVRRKDGAEASPVSRAEAALADGDLAGASQVLDSGKPLGDAGAAWLEDVRARVIVETEVEALYGRVIAPLADRGASAR